MNYSPEDLTKNQGEPAGREGRGGGGGKGTPQVTSCPSYGIWPQSTGDARDPT